MQRGSATLRQDIADVIVENNLGEGEFVGEQIMPVMPVGARSGEFMKIDFSEIKTAVVDDLKSSSGNYNEVAHEVTSDTFTCRKRGLEEAVSDDDEAVLGDYFDVEVAAADHCRYYLRLNREARVAAIAFDTTVMASYTSALTTPWSTAATATPVDDIQAAIDNIVITQLNGRKGNARIIGVGNAQARRDLINTADVKDRHYSGGNENRAVIRNEQLAEVLGLDGIYFSGLLRGGAAIWNADRFGVYLVGNGPMRSQATFGRVFLWRDSTPTDMMVQTYRDEKRESDMVRVKHHSTEKLLTARAGYLYTNVD